MEQSLSWEADSCLDIQRIPVFHAAGMSITECTRARHFTLSWGKLNPVHIFTSFCFYNPFQYFNPM
jgi:hypothetical protein